MLYQNKCSGCGKRIDSFATDRSGTLPRIFCNSVCRTDYEKEKQFDLAKPKVNAVFKKSITSDELTKRLENSSFSPNNGGQYVTENQVVMEEIPI